MPTILVYDHDARQRQAVCDVLSAHGSDWKIVAAADESMLANAIDEHAIDLVVTEVPVDDRGRDELGSLRRHLIHVPVLVIADDEPVRIDALVVGAASYVPRSAMARDLVAVSHRLLTLSGCHRRHARLLEGLVGTEVVFKIQGNDLGMVPVLCGHLVDGLEEFELRGNGDRIHAAVALEEAMTNGIVHGNLEVSSRLRERDDDAYERTIAERRESVPYAHRLLTVTGRYNRLMAVIEVRDEGPGFDPAIVDDPTHPANLDRPHGRGLYLIRAFADEVRFNETGNTITLLFRPRVTS